MAGTVDVDGLLDSMTPEQFNEWAAYDVVEPIVHSERLQAYLVQMLSKWMGHEVDAEVVTPWLEPPKFDPASLRKQ